MPNFEFPALRDARAKYGEAQKRLASVFSEAGPDMDFSKVKSLSGDTAAKLAEVQKMDKELPELKADVDKYFALATAAERSRNEEAKGGVERGSENGDERGSKGSDNFGASVYDSLFKKGRYQAGQGVGSVQRVETKSNFLTTAGWDPEDTRTGKLVLTALRPAPHVVDFIPKTSTSQSTVVYMEETTFTNNATEEAEAGEYGEAALALTERTSEVRKVAVWLPFSDEQIEDEERAKGYINNRLMYMLRNRLDLQVLTGDGTAPNLSGTEDIASTNTQALGSDTTVDALYKGMRQIRDTGFAEPSVVFIRPSKWEAVRLGKTADGQYIWGHPSIPGPTTVWGVPVVETTVPTATKAIIGDYTNYAELAVRRGVDVQMTNSHSTHFIHGLQAIRADLRVALIHYRATAFTIVTGL